MTCDKCNATAIEYMPYNGMHLCKKHFMEFVEKRVKKELRRQFNVTAGTKIAVALSGGKDSTLALYFIHKIYGKHKNVDIFAITVDEGIEGYRPPSIRTAARNCKMLAVTHKIISFSEAFNTTMDKIARVVERKYGACSYCGVLRRRALNTAARDLGATYLVLGTNLDDYSQSILMNFVSGNLEKLARLGPHRKAREGFVPRILPLRLIPERETYLYAMLAGIDFYDAACPYAIEANRGLYRRILHELEEATPGVRHAIVNAYEKILPYLEAQYSSTKIGRCQRCREPTPNVLCKVCQMLEELQHERT